MRAANALRGLDRTSAQRALLDDRAVLDDDDPVGEQERVEDVVGDHHHRAVGEDPAQGLS